MSRMSSNRSDFSSAVVNGKIYAISSYDDRLPTLKSAEVYDIVSNKLQEIKLMATNRLGHTSITFEGEIYVIGGWNGFCHMNWVEKFNPEEHNWTFCGYMRMARRGACAMLVGNKVHKFGGDDGETWIRADIETYIVDRDGMEFYDYVIPDMPEALYHLSASLVAPNIIMVVGGEVDTSEEESEEFQQVYLLHLEEKIWTGGLGI